MLVLNSADLKTLVDDLAGAHRVPGMAVAVVVRGSPTLVTVSGVADIGVGEPVTQSTMFRIGSVTKIFTATLVMRAMTEGLLDLDEPLVNVIPAFALADHAATTLITLRHALSKSDGVYDHVAGFGTDDECVARYVRSLSAVGQGFAPGSLYGYANTGAILAARALEVAYDAPFDAILNDKLLGPAALTATAHIPDNIDSTPNGAVELAGHQLAARHTHDNDGTPRVGGRAGPPALAEPRAMAACGTTLASSIEDLARFLRLHLDTERPSWLDKDAVTAMQAPQVSVDELDLGSALGWAAPPSRPWVLGHNGGSRPPGTFAQLTIAAAAGVGVGVVANAMTGAIAASAITEVVLTDAGVSPRVRLPAAPCPDTASCEGTYERGHARFTVEATSTTALSVTVEPGPLGDQDVKIGTGGTYTAGPAPWFTGPGGRLTLLRPDRHHRPTILHDGRAARRTDI